MKKKGNVSRGGAEDAEKSKTYRRAEGRIQPRMEERRGVVGGAWLGG